MSGEITFYSIIVSCTGLAGGAWAFLKRENPIPLAISGAVSTGMVWTILKTRQEPSSRGSHGRWIVPGIVGCAVLACSAFSGMPWPVSAAAVVEGGLLTFVFLMSGFVG